MYNMNTQQITIFIIIIGLLSAMVIITAFMMRDILEIKSIKQATLELEEFKNPLSDLHYQDLFTLLDVIITNEVKNFISVNNLKNKENTMKSASLEDNIIDLSMKIYTEVLSVDYLDQLELYVTSSYIEEYISRSIRDALVYGSYKK